VDAKVDALGVLEILVREPVDSDFTEWRGLWGEYLTFYKTARSEPQIVSLWHRLLDPEDPVECLVAEVDGHVVGITHYLPHADTWDERPICYLSDLYVHSSTRGEGIATLLIRAVEQRSNDQGWSSVYWQTAEDNQQARVLYDKITGGASGFIIYELDLDKSD